MSSQATIQTVPEPLSTPESQLAGFDPHTQLPDLVAGVLGDEAAAAQAIASLYKGGSDQWFVTYELGLDDDGDGSCPQVIRVYLSGQLRGWELGQFPTRSGALVRGVKIEYARTHDRYRRRDELDERSCSGCFAKVIELPPGAHNVEVRAALPDRYRHALHRY